MGGAMDRALGIYIHIPFCVRKCSYCDFTSFAGIDEELKNRYIKCLLKQIEQAAEGRLLGEKGDGEVLSPMKGRTVDSVFFGGGTPSLLSPDQIGQVTESLRRHFSLTPDCEITMEANPGTVTGETLREYRRLGINRLSFGVQSMEDEILARLGRIHRSGDAAASAELAREAGFDNLNLDLMFGIPDQTRKQWRSTLEKITALAPEHISFYSLQVEEGTPIYNDIKYGRLTPLSDEEDRAMYHEGLAYLEERGYRQYEISNGAKPGRECRHNLKYWTLQEYLGLGVSAHGFAEGMRYSSGDDLNDYIRALEREESPVNWAHKNTVSETAAEFLFTGLRLSRGVDLEEFRRRFGSSLEEKYAGEMEELGRFRDQGFVAAETGEDGGLRRLRLTRRGMDISNRIMALFV